MGKCTIGYSFLNRRLNENYSQAIVQPLRPCLLHHNSENYSEIYQAIRIATQPKYFTNLIKYVADTETGEISLEKYQTDDFKSKKGRIFKKIKVFADIWQPLYTKKRVSIFFLTFTMANGANMKFSDMIDNVKYRYKSIGFKIKAYFWVSEVSDNHQWHYHLCVVTDRMNLKGKKMPKEIKFERLWGKWTGITFVEKSIQSYLTGYLNKSQATVIVDERTLRGCGSSKMPKVETLKNNSDANSQEKARPKEKISKLLHPVYA